MSHITAEKKELRQLIKHLKHEHSHELRLQRSENIMAKVEQLPQFKKASTIMAYWSFDGEVYTQDALVKWAANKRIILPSVDGDTMNLKVFTSVDHLVPGDMFAIPEPAGELFFDYNAIDFIIVPGVAFDTNNNRMGRGKAYYDRFLSAMTAAFKVGVCFSFQLFDRVPVDEYDRPVDMVVTNDIDHAANVNEF